MQDYVDQRLPASNFVPYVIKEDTGDPSTGSTGMICINTFDKTIKIYAGGAWRGLTLTASWT